MTRSREITRLIPFAIAAVILFMYISSVSAQPGTDADPVISLSYLESALSYSPVVLEGGEDLDIACGSPVILVTGNCFIMPGTDDCHIIDLTDGDVMDESASMDPGHLYVVISTDDESTFTVRSIQSSTIAITGGSGR